MKSRDELKHIIVFEHEKLLVNQGETYLTEGQHQALETYHGNYSPFFKLIRNGVQFCEFVGVLQVGSTTIEVLPKADKSDDKTMWQSLLVNMIRTVWGFPVMDSGFSDLKLQQNSVLDLYFELFVREIEHLIHAGLIKKYVREERNSNALKGKLLFNKNLSHNLVHKERFYIETARYTHDHQWHQILFAALKVVSQLNRNSSLASRIGNLLLTFPAQSKISINSRVFDKLQYDRKTISYKKAVDIAELLLLNYHPDISRGKWDVLSLMFDMNTLWEKFILGLLSKSMTEFKVSGQVSKKFWKGVQSVGSSMRPDIVLSHSAKPCVIVLDTKWKNLESKGPSPEDLRQMYVYQEYFDAHKVALVYPGDELTLSGNFYRIDQTGPGERQCHIVQIKPDPNFGVWKRRIVERIRELLDEDQLRLVK